VPTANIRAKIAAGTRPLPENAPGKVWVGYGNGRPCDGCDDPITTVQLEYEVDISDRTLRFHSKCLEAWHQERIDRQAD
jgi:hypothetical protein